MTKYFDTKNGTLENAVLSVYEKKLDPVNKDAVKKKFDDRKDKDIDNDGDVDSTDKFLHKRRKAITKAIEKEGNMFTLKLAQARKNGDKSMLIGKKEYPVKDVEGKNRALYKRYEEEADKIKNMEFIGRCGKYVYIDMQQAVNMALKTGERYENERHSKNIYE